MKFRVEVTKSAQEQIRQAHNWYKQNFPSSADSWFNGLFKALSTLKQFPDRCQLAPEHDEFQAEVRQLLYGNRKNAYRILFTVRDKTIFVLHFRHHAQARLTEEDFYEGEPGPEE